jgi:hypothetical protein
MTVKKKNVGTYFGDTKESIRQQLNKKSDVGIAKNRAHIQIILPK